MKKVTSKNKQLKKDIKKMRFSGRVGLLLDRTFWKQKLGAVFVGKSKDCFKMKKLTYLEEFLLGRVQFSLQR